MTPRPTLSDALLDLVEAVLPRVSSDAVVDGTDPGSAPTPPVRLTGARIDVPLEVAVEVADGEPVLLAHPRRWRLETVFDPRPSRLSIALATTAVAGEVGRHD